jgi:hypothetical protein
MIVGCAAVAVSVGFACGSGDTIKSPVSDTQFDDPDEPGSKGSVGTVDATTIDAPEPAAKACSSTQPCGPGETCFYPPTAGCATPVGQCVEFLAVPSCPSQRFCDCAGQPFLECAPPNMASQPNQPLSTCASVELDAGPG